MAFLKMEAKGTEIASADTSGHKLKLDLCSSSTTEVSTHSFWPI